MNELDRNILDLERSRWNSFGCKVESLVLIHKGIMHLHVQNIKDVLNLLNRFSDVEYVNSLLTDSENKSEKFFMLNEVARFMHNWASSAKTQADLTRSTIRKFYAENSITIHIDEKTENFKNKPIIQFVHKLRNSSNHHKSPPVIASIGYTIGEEPNSNIIFKVEDLKNIELNKEAKEYVNSHAHKINISELVKEYNSEVIPFHEWLLKHHTETYRESLEELETIKNEVQKLREQKLSN